MADYKPGDLLVGVVDFFAILLPGAMLAFVGMKFQGAIFNDRILPQLGDGAPRWIAFILASYLIGHFVFLVGSALLDPVYGETYGKFKYGKAGGGKLLDRAKELKLHRLGAYDQIENTFKWARASVRLRSAEAAAEIDRLEANSKFFRSLVVVLFIVSIVFAVGSAKWISAICFVLLCLSFWRFSDQRWKMTQTAYLYFVILESQPPDRKEK